MELHELKPHPKSKRERRRVARGIAAGQGKTAGRGTKGQRARSGWGGKLYRQGGNLPFYRSLPFKRGFTNIYRPDWQEINLGRLAGFKKGARVTPESMFAAGLLSDAHRPVALLGQGEVKAALEVHVHRATRSAREKIEAAGGTLVILEL